MTHRGERGAVLPLIALCLAVLMGFGGLAVDVGYWEFQQREQQNAADAAAIGGAQQLLYSSSCPDRTNAQAAAYKDATNSGYTNGVANVTVHVENPPSSGTFSSSNCAVRVQITKTQVATFFSRLFGAANNNGMNETTEATAEVLHDGQPCIFMLGAGDNTNFNTSTVQAPKCSIEVNGTANFNGSTIDAGSVGEGNYSGSNNGGTFSSATPAPMVPVADPCPEIAPCEALTTSPPSTSPCNGVYSGNGVLTAGCYNNLSLNGLTVTLQPSATSSIFVLEGSSNFNGATIYGNGVTLYIPAGGSTNLNKATSLTLIPPTTGSNAGVSYYQVPGNTNAANLNATTSNIGGLVYAPSAQLNYNGAQGQYTVLVAQYMNFNGSSSEDFAAAPTNQSLIGRAVLAL